MDKVRRERAVHHALLIQHQKDVEAKILESIEALIDYPKKTTSVESPDPTDVSEVKRHLALFRPSDFDSVIEERNTVEKCGYMLCPNTRIKHKGSGKLRFIYGRNLEVVKKEDLEKWCSDDCAKCAHYLRGQLSNTPPWERGDIHDGGLILYGEHESHEFTRGEVDNLTRGINQLALERGDSPQSFRSKSTNVEVQERPTEMQLASNAPIGDPDASMEIEGFTTGLLGGGRILNVLDGNELNDDDDMLDTI